MKEKKLKTLLKFLIIPLFIISSFKNLNITYAAEIPFEQLSEYYDGCVAPGQEAVAENLKYQKIICVCHINYMRNHMSYQELVKVNMAIYNNEPIPIIINYMNDICVKELINDLENKDDTDNSKYYFDSISVDSSSSMYNFNINTIIGIKSNLGNITINGIDYINSKGRLISCSNIELTANRSLGKHLRSYLLYPSNKCFKDSLLTRVTLKVECPEFGILDFSKICEDDKNLIEFFFPANINKNILSNININNNKKNIVVVLPYATISQYYGGFVNHNNYTVNELFFKNNTSLPIKQKKYKLDDTSYYLLLSYFIESIHKWNTANNDKYNIKFVYDFNLNSNSLNNNDILLFPHHAEYSETTFLDAIINYKNIESDNKLKILNFAAANFFRPIKYNEDSIILFTKKKSKIADLHIDKMNKLCIPIYESNFCSLDQSSDEDWISFNKLVNYNKKMYFPVCGERNNFFSEKEVFSSNNTNIEFSDKLHMPYTAEYAKSNCNNKILLSHSINGNDFPMITISGNSEVDIFNVNTNGLGINFFTSDLAISLLENFLDN